MGRKYSSKSRLTMTNEKILVIEDEEKISGIVKSYLEREGFTVTLAKPLEISWGRFKILKGDLVLLSTDGPHHEVPEGEIVSS